MLKLIWLIRDRNEWKRRAESLEERFEKERTSNRRYEREMTSRMLTMAGQMGIAQEKVVEPKVPQVLPPIPPQPTASVLGDLTPMQAATWEMYKEDAQNVGLTENQAWQDFFQREILSKMTIMDDDRVDVEN